jgi:anti-sigma regulatory factor (Ser/Thr protein kinase)
MPSGDRPNAARTQPRLRRPNGLPQAAGRTPTNRRVTRPVLDQPFDAGNMLPLRSAVAAYAAELGAGARVDDLVLIAHELASNAVRHGGGSGRLRLWRDDYRVICRVSDGGRGITDAAGAGAELPPPRSAGGRGLWIARRLAAVHIDSGPTGTTITAAVPLP